MRSQKLYFAICNIDARKQPDTRPAHRFHTGLWNSAAFFAPRFTRRQRHALARGTRPQAATQNTTRLLAQLSTGHSRYFEAVRSIAARHALRPDVPGPTLALPPRLRVALA